MDYLYLILALLITLAGISVYSFLFYRNRFIAASFACLVFGLPAVILARMAGYDAVAYVVGGLLFGLLLFAGVVREQMGKWRCPRCGKWFPCGRKIHEETVKESDDSSGWHGHKYRTFQCSNCQERWVTKEPIGSYD